MNELIKNASITWINLRTQVQIHDPQEQSKHYTNLQSITVITVFKGTPTPFTATKSIVSGAAYAAAHTLTTKHIAMKCPARYKGTNNRGILVMRAAANIRYSKNPKIPLWKASETPRENGDWLSGVFAFLIGSWLIPGSL